MKHYKIVDKATGIVLFNSKNSKPDGYENDKVEDIANQHITEAAETPEMVEIEYFY